MKSKISTVLIVCWLISGCALFKQVTVTFQGNSMLPTIKDGEKLTVLRLDTKSPAQLVRGDIVLFRSPLDQSKSYIKRVIALPGDQIEIKSGEIWLNGKRLEEPYLSSRLNLAQRSQAASVVPPHSYFILGDNRDNSADSRIWGSVPEELIDAKVINR